MGFSPTIKQQVMNATARHCCVCHRYKGVKLEVHHIIQEADNGPNTFENAIPLCFDCHSDAGHYNDRHPKGTKFSITELRNARDNWYKFVTENPITQKAIISNSIQTGYYVVNAFDILDSILQGDYTSIGKSRNRIYLKKNYVSSIWENLLNAHSIDFDYNIEQRLLIEIRHFNSIEEYCETYIGVKVTDKSSEDYPYFEVTRKSNWTDLISIVKKNSFLKQLSESGIEAETFCTAVLYKNGEGCDGGNPEFAYTEYLEVSPISFVLLGITNTSGESIKLNKVITEDGQPVALPNFNLLPYEMVFIPIKTVINVVNYDSNAIILDHIDGERGQDFSRILNSNGKFENVSYFKDNICPTSVIYNDNSDEIEVDIHELDFNNLYSLNSYWQCGSCPHLFFINQNGVQEYVRELLVTSSMKKGTDSFSIPENVYEIIIRELEDEVTFIDSIKINDNETHRNIVLEKDHYLTLSVSPFDTVTLEGHYEPFRPSKPRINDIWKRNKIVKESNKSFNRRRQEV
jgi:hypothetical protein